MGERCESYALKIVSENAFLPGKVTEFSEIESAALGPCYNFRLGSNEVL